jgi:hypothetical protein
MSRTMAIHSVQHSLHSAISIWDCLPCRQGLISCRLSTRSSIQLAVLLQRHAAHLIPRIPETANAGRPTYSAFSPPTTFRPSSTNTPPATNGETGATGESVGTVARGGEGGGEGDPRGNCARYSLVRGCAGPEGRRSKRFHSAALRSN